MCKTKDNNKQYRLHLKLTVVEFDYDSLCGFICHFSEEKKLRRKQRHQVKLSQSKNELIDLICL